MKHRSMLKRWFQVDTGFFDRTPFQKLFTGLTDFEEDRKMIMVSVLEQAKKKESNENEGKLISSHKSTKLWKTGFNVFRVTKYEIIVINAGFKDLMFSALKHIDEFKHTSLWYICANGFTKILETLIDENTFGIKDIVVEELKNCIEEPRPLWIATFNGKSNMVEMLQNEPFSLSPGTESCGISPSMLASLKFQPGLQKLIDSIEPAPLSDVKLYKKKIIKNSSLYRDNLITGDPKILTSNQKSPVIKSAGSCENGLKQC